MRALEVAMVVAALVVPAAPALAFNWSIGGNLGASFLMLDESDETATLFSWPSQGLLTLFGTPGMRVGFAGENPQHEFYFDTGLSIISIADETLSTTQITGNYQYNFATQGATGPYLTGGLGFASINGDGAGALSLVFGAGVGLRHRMGHGHGTMRGEVRFDHMNTGEDDGFTLIEASNNVSFKLGFDVWGK